MFVKSSVTLNLRETHSWRTEVKQTLKHKVFLHRTGKTENTADVDC